MCKLVYVPLFQYRIERCQLLEIDRATYNRNVERRKVKLKVQVSTKDKHHHRRDKESMHLTMLTYTHINRNLATHIAVIVD